MRYDETNIDRSCFPQIDRIILAAIYVRNHWRTSLTMPSMASISKSIRPDRHSEIGKRLWMALVTCGMIDPESNRMTDDFDDKLRVLQMLSVYFPKSNNKQMVYVR